MASCDAQEAWQVHHQATRLDECRYAPRLTFCKTRLTRPLKTLSRASWKPKSKTPPSFPLFQTIIVRSACLSFSSKSAYHLEEQTWLNHDGSAPDDVDSAEEVRRLIQDLGDLRHTKIRQGVADIKESVAVRLRNISQLEVNAVRPFFTQAMDTFLQLS